MKYNLFYFNKFTQGGGIENYTEQDVTNSNAEVGKQLDWTTSVYDRLFTKEGWEKNLSDLEDGSAVLSLTSHPYVRVLGAIGGTLADLGQAGIEVSKGNKTAAMGNIGEIALNYTGGKVAKVATKHAPQIYKFLRSKSFSDKTARNIIISLKKGSVPISTVLPILKKYMK